MHGDGVAEVGWHESEPSVRHRQQVVPDPAAALGGEGRAAAGVWQPLPHHTVRVA
ncbi:hypothetical protein JYU34_018374 [Plutella xylostella]|uniref:Uncharacterized protein n=1 Tax=Plutella xylostella TaxID=51655 RepID=A0ABQ7PXE6_PLUXY|nr:hypothetical protein JYU34_018374 [Plutella xylostella]